jgi:hypothetical protein
MKRFIFFTQILIISSIVNARQIKTSPILLSSDSQTDTIDGCSHFRNISQIMKKSIIESYGKSITSYEWIRFSPNGRWLALYFWVADYGFQLWSYDLESKNSQWIAGKTNHCGDSMRVLHTEWIGTDTLRANIYKTNVYDSTYCIYASSGFVSEYSAPIRLYDDDDNQKRVDWDTVSFSPSHRFICVVRLRPDSTFVVDLKQNKKYFICAKNLSYGGLFTTDEQYFVFLEQEEGKGFDGILKKLKLDSDISISTIYEGSWPTLIHFDIYPHSHRIVFIDNCPQGYEIVDYNLTSERIKGIIKTGINPRMVAWSAQNVLAIVCGDCDWESSKQFHELFLLDRNPH